MTVSHKAEVSQEVYLLPLTDSGSPDVEGQYIYLPPPTEPPYLVRFEIEGTSSICRGGSLWVNIPKRGQLFERDKYQEHKLRPDFNGILKVDIPVTSAGAFAFYTSYSPLPDFSTSPPRAGSLISTKSPLYYIDVSPRLTLGGSLLPLDALSIFSVVSKFMGKYPNDWEKHFSSIAQRNYNMVHFTPLMERGDSNSPYSIYDQLRFDPSFFRSEQDIAAMVEKMEKEYGLLGLTDVVWNHTANNSKWLEEHPEVGYNIETAPWLESALELDTALLKFGEELQEHGLPNDLKNKGDLEQLIKGVREHVIDPMKLWEYYVIDVRENTEQIERAWVGSKSSDGKDSNEAFEGLDLAGCKSWSRKQKTEFVRQHCLNGANSLGPRFSRKVDPGLASAFFQILYSDGDTTGGRWPGEASSLVTDIINDINVSFYQDFNSDLNVILQQLQDRIRYLRLDDDGPKLGPISKSSPLIESYFTRLPLNETTRKHSPKSLALVNNGWIWAADALKDNAGSDSRAYLRREVIVWSDCVKLRYGQTPQDSQFLWDFMTQYTQLMAKYFTAFRIDNCHSTPIFVAEYLLDKARQVRPDLAVFAELFTGSEETDYVFVKRLGISALIRESMQAWSTQEVSRLVHMHAGRPIGSFEVDEISTSSSRSNYEHLTNGVNGTNGSITHKPERVHRIRQSPIRALFTDCTHDNEVPAQKRDARDTLPNAALVDMCASAEGSVMGYDEIYPKHLDIVQETRTYMSTSLDRSSKAEGQPGIGQTKKLLNQLHTLMGQDGYDETFIHHEGEYITVHRVHPLSRKGYFLAAHTAFPGYGEGHGALSPVHLSGSQAKIICCQRLEVEMSEAKVQSILGNERHLDGLPSKVIDLDGVQIESKSGDTVLTMPAEFGPGSIALFETWMPGAEHSEGLDSFVTSGAVEAFSELDLVDLNFLLYRCEPEERDLSGGSDGVYTVPNYGPLVYAGVQGWWSILKDVIRKNDLGHPLCNHLRDGQWALDYTVNRLNRIAEWEQRPSLHRAATWFSERFEAIRKLPGFLLPRYFALVIQTAYNTAVARGISLFSSNIQNGQKFLQALAMTSIQMTGFTKSASLYPVESKPSLAAGLPHFSTSWARCWGRDTFIALRGLFIGTGRYDDAREHILAFASVLKHGMIPNLLSHGKNPRYNSRDSVWFFLQNVQEYVKLVPNGVSILKERIKRRFLPYDDTYFEFDDPRAYSHESTISEIIQEIFQRHASGLSFREANAGPNLDMQMKPEGFQIDVRVDWNTGIIFGGNQFNCGTWMDKMGESEKAGSKGIPGTPRDGAAIELTGLLHSALKWVAELHSQSLHEWSGIKTTESGDVTFQDWASKIQANFEKCYYVPLDSAEDPHYKVNPSIINRRGIYKDLYLSGKEYEDYQLRPNFCIAMTVAPDLFDPSHALQALETADRVLRGPTGMATLDPSDLNYRPYYNNSEDSTDFATSKGRNYHQGPEWLWPTGFFLRALLKFDLMRRTTSEGRTEAFQQVTIRLAGCKEAIETSPWAGLTELTNKNGEYCADSSPTQAWSSGCLIDLFCDAWEVTQKSPK